MTCPVPAALGLLHWGAISTTSRAGISSFGVSVGCSSCLVEPGKGDFGDGCPTGPHCSPGRVCVFAQAARPSSWVSLAPASPPCSGAPPAPLPPVGWRHSMVMAVMGPQPRHGSPLTPVRQRGGTPHRPTPPISTGQVAVGTHPKSPHSGGLRGRARPTARPEACGCHGDATLPPPRVGLRPTASRTPQSRGLQLRAPNTGLGPTPPCPPPPPQGRAPSVPLAPQWGRDRLRDSGQKG